MLFGQDRVAAREMGRHLKTKVLLAVLFLTLGGRGIRCQQTGTGSNSSSSKKKAAKKQPEKEPETYTLVGAGDIAWCGNLAGAEATAKLIDRIPGTVFAAGDLAYEDGTDEEFRNCYNPTWGRFRDRTKPAPGNHEYNGSVASGYFRYWGEQAGEAEKGYYSFDLGPWHIISLNTNCEIRALHGCGEGSPEEVRRNAEVRAIYLGEGLVYDAHHRDGVSP